MTLCQSLRAGEGEGADMRFDVNKHIVFSLAHRETKTNVWEVLNTWAHCCIGIVKWYPPLRHYCFFPYADSVFCDRCLIKIGQFVKEQDRLRADVDAEAGKEKLCGSQL